MLVSPERFEELVAEALDGIPPELGRRMDNVAVFVEDRGRQASLLGLYHGVPLTVARCGVRRDGDARPDHDLPAADLRDVPRPKTEVVHQVRVTVVHEVAHHFGIDDNRLAELGWA